MSNDRVFLVQFIEFALLEKHYAIKILRFMLPELLFEVAKVIGCFPRYIECSWIVVRRALLVAISILDIAWF